MYINTALGSLSPKLAQLCIVTVHIRVISQLLRGFFAFTLRSAAGARFLFSPVPVGSRCGELDALQPPPPPPGVANAGEDEGVGWGPDGEDVSPCKPGFF